MEALLGIDEVRIAGRKEASIVLLDEFGPVWSDLAVRRLSPPLLRDFAVDREDALSVVVDQPL